MLRKLQMWPDYEDIRSRISEEPVWFDSNGVPRYEPFSPVAVPNIYAKEAVLYLVRCQSCGKKFKVADDRGTIDKLRKISDLEHLIKEGALHYGDAPRHNCVGDTMNCEDIRVLEYWRRETMDWVHHPELQIMLPDGEELLSAG